MKKYTKKQALKDCIELWEYIAEWDVNKVQAIEDIDKGYDWECMCPLCEYVTRTAGFRDCSYCPIPPKEWTRNKGYVTLTKIFDTCTSRSSPFNKWAYAKHPSDRRKFAMQLVRKAKKQLKK